MKMQAVVLALMACAASTQAAVIINFKPVPTSSAQPEFTWNGAALDEGPGNLSNGDGGLPLANQIAPGLQFDTPFLINGVAGSSVNIASGTTTFFDSSLTLTGFAGAAPAQSVFGVLVQPLDLGDFTLKATDGTLLLHGTVTSSTIAGSSGASAGATFSAANVSYDSGLIYTALVTQGGSVSGNDFSFSFVDVSPTFAATAGAPLDPFTANATGLFSAVAVPEPSAIASIIVGAALLARRRRS